MLIQILAYEEWDPDGSTHSIPQTKQVSEKMMEYPIPQTKHP